MNLPNKLTLARVLMVPIFVICYCIPFPGHYFCAALVFSLASITDAVDGKLALVTALVYLSFRYDFHAFGLNVPDVVYFGIEVFLQVVFWIAALLTLWSGVQYLVHYRNDINPNS